MVIHKAADDAAVHTAEHFHPDTHEVFGAVIVVFLADDDGALHTLTHTHISLTDD